MKPGRKPKRPELKLVNGTERNDRPVMEQVKPAGEIVRPSFLKGRARKIWDEKIGLLVDPTEYELSVLATFCTLRAEFESAPDNMVTARMVEMRRCAEAIFTSRSLMDDGKKAKDPASKYGL